MSIETELVVWLAAWPVVAAIVLVRHWRESGVGLIFAYVLSFGTIHWLGAVIQAVPWYPAQQIDYTALGLRVSVVAIAAFAVGGEVGAALFGRRAPLPPVVDRTIVSPRIIATYIAAGVLSYVVLQPIAARLPTATALASTASSLSVVGVALAAWNAWQRGHRVMTWMWLAASVVFPLVTVVSQGFLGFGFAAMAVVATFVAGFYRPRWHVVVAAMLVAFLGLSVYVTYMRDRRAIRAVVWGGETVSQRLDLVGDTVEQFEWFDPWNIEHLRRIDERLNQNALVGRAVDRIDSGAVPPAYGATLVEAGQALIPRALWPEKPVAAGSGDLVSFYTGILFAHETSVGIGHVMEWYVNFAMAGVVFGFAFFGAVIVYVDRSAAAWLHRGNAGRFAMWFMPGMSLLVVGGSFVEATGTAAASLVVVWLARQLTDRWELAVEEPIYDGWEGR